MDNRKKERFLQRWRRYFHETALPVVFFYTDREVDGISTEPSVGHRCIFADIRQALEGKIVVLKKETIGCFGGRRYLGFEGGFRADFEYFLSCGKEGMEGERYKKSPELVKEIMKKLPSFRAPHPFMVFKRWDMVEEKDMPEVVIFFASPDVISALFTLANFDKADDNVICPFGSGCSSVVLYPYLQRFSPEPKCVLGLFDISARPYFDPSILSFAMPTERFFEMVENMDESFLRTRSWQSLRPRIL